MIPLNDSYFEDEIREGFYVPAEIKQAWGAQIEVLNEIDRVCKKHGLKYFAAWGTLLGAVRHKGIIPWDDDFDIMMLRSDYEKFMEVYKDEMPEGFDVITFRNNPDHIQFISNVVGRRRICFEKEHLERFHGFAYICGIDIFLMDNLTSDGNKEKDRLKIADLIIRIADSIYGGSIKGKDVRESIRNIEKWCKIKVPDNLQGVELRIYLYSAAEKWISNVSDDKADKISQIIPWGIRGRDYVFPRNHYDVVCEIPFEGGTIPATPYYYEQLRKSYGDFMKIYKDTGGHNYPFFEKQKEDLQSVLDFEMPGYRFSKEMICEKREKSDKANSYKAKAEGVANILMELCDSIECKSVDNEVIAILGDLQQVAIELGTYIERIKGEGYITVGRLEELCELAFKYCSVTDPRTLFEMKKIISEVKEDITCRREVIFMPYKAEYWKRFEDEYKKACNDPLNDVKVVPIPYYYKNYDGSLRDIQYYPEDYPEDINIIKYDEFDLSEHCPEVIYIQNPYDEFNAATSIYPGYYSSVLRRYTDELIYVPWFKTAEFDKKDARAYKNMKYYVQMPGVINSDVVLVQSENIKQLYIDKLSEFAGEDTKEYWEKKIKVEKKAVIKEDDSRQKDMSCQRDDNGCRKILYANDFSVMLCSENDPIEKIKRVMETFAVRAGKEKVKIYWGIDRESLDILRQTNEELFNQYSLITDKYAKEGVCEFIEIPRAQFLEGFVKNFDGYYGDPGAVPHHCRNAGIPVMIQA